MPTKAQPLAPWVAPVTASCGHGRADAHTAYSCQFPCWDPSRACFLHEGVGSGWGGAVQISKAGHPQAAGPGALAGGREQGQRACSLHSYPQPRVYPEASFVLSRGAQKMGLGEPLLQVPAAERKGQAGLCRKAGVRPCLTGKCRPPAAGHLGHPRARAWPSREAVPAACGVTGSHQALSAVAGSEQGGKSPGKPYVKSHDLRVNGSGTSNEEIMPAG